MSESLEGRGKEAKNETLNQSSEAGAQVRVMHVKQQSGGGEVKGCGVTISQTHQETKGEKSNQLN